MTQHNILIIGSGAREHAIVKTLSQSAHTPLLFCFSGAVNPAIADLTTHYGTGDINNAHAVTTYAQTHAITMAFIGPEAPLEQGIADALWGIGVPTVAPTKDHAQLESSKGFTRDLLAQYGIQGNPFYQSFSTMDGVDEVLKTWAERHVIKADGLMGGKGVKVYGDHLFSHQDSLNYCTEIINNGGKFVIEEKLVGQEFSLISFCDGKTLRHMPIVQDHKRAYVGDKGANTGGMGTYTDTNHALPFISPTDITTAQNINQATADALYDKFGTPYRGILYGGFMATADGVRLIEYNARFGDPEAMNLLSLLQTDLVDICTAIVGGTLDQINVQFAHQATVCKYLVPKGYPENPLKNIPVDLSQISPDVPVFLGAVDTDQNGTIIATGSRTLAVVGMGDTIAHAEHIAESEISKIQGDFFHRPDIGTNPLINQRISHMNTLRGDGTYTPL